jgi:hypothetical protein
MRPRRDMPHITTRVTIPHRGCSTGSKAESVKFRGSATWVVASIIVEASVLKRTEPNGPSFRRIALISKSSSVFAVALISSFAGCAYLGDMSLRFETAERVNSTLPQDPVFNEAIATHTDVVRLTFAADRNIRAAVNHGQLNVSTNAAFCDGARESLGPIPTIFDADGPISLHKTSGSPASEDHRVWIYIYAHRDRASQSATEAGQHTKYDLAQSTRDVCVTINALTMVLSGFTSQEVIIKAAALQSAVLKELPSTASNYLPD